MTTCDVGRIMSHVTLVSSSRSNTGMLLIWVDWVIIISDVKTKSLWVDVAVSEEEESTKDWLGQDIEDTIKDSLGIRSNDVSALGQSPGNWVDEPEEDGPDSADEENSLDVGTNGGCMLQADNANVIGNEEESDHGEGEIAPFV